MCCYYGDSMACKAAITSCPNACRAASLAAATSWARIGHNGRAGAGWNTVAHGAIDPIEHQSMQVNVQIGIQDGRMTALPVVCVSKSL